MKVTRLNRLRIIWKHLNYTKMIEEYLKSLNPKDTELVFGQKYALYRDKEYIGTAIWTKDENVGDSFQIQVDGKTVVCIPDSWHLIN